MAFCVEYLQDLNGTQAAIRAGYSARSADVTSARLLADEKVKAEIALRIERRNERVEVDSDWVLRRLAQIADVDFWPTS